MTACFAPEALFGGLPKPSYSFVGSTADYSNTTVYTFSGHALGTAGITRLVVVTVSSDGGAGQDVSGVTIAGVTAVKAEGVIDAGGSISAIWAAPVPTGTTGDIVITHAGGKTRCIVGVYALYDLASITKQTSATDTVPATNTLDGAIAVQADAIVIATTVNGSSSRTVNWTNATSDYVENSEGSHAGASTQVTAANASYTVTAEWSASTAQSFAVASFL